MGWRSVPGHHRFLLKGRSRDVREVGRQLAVDYLLEGSVLRAGDELHVDVQFVRTRDVVPLWSGSYDRPMADIFDIQDEISLAIVNNLRLRLGRGRRRYETSVAAYDEYLRARGVTFGQEGPRGFISIPAFERAIARDPAFAPAYAGLAAAYAIKSIQYPEEDHPPDEVPKMRATAEKAIKLDPLLPEAYNALGMADAREGRWDQADRSFRKAIELDPNRSRTRVDYAMWFLDTVGRNDEGIEQARRALSSDPLSPDVRLALAWLLMSTGRYEEAADHCAQMPADNTLRIQWLARARSGQGRSNEAIALFEADPYLSRNPQTRGFLGFTLAHSGRRRGWRLPPPGRTRRRSSTPGWATRTKTFDALARMGSLSTQRVGGYLNSPEMGLLRGDPRLPQLRRQVGLPD
jgi:serine/threonine-protein kinase